MNPSSIAQNVSGTGYPQNMLYSLFFSTTLLLALQEAPDLYFPWPSHSISHFFKEPGFFREWYLESIIWVLIAIEVSLFLGSLTR